MEILAGCGKQVKHHVNQVTRGGWGVADVELSGSDIAELYEMTATSALYPVWVEPMGAHRKIKEALG